MSSSIKCWLFGCKPHPQDPAPVDCVQCDSCGELMGYHDFVTPSRWQNTKAWFRYWLFRKWFPERCIDCSKRRGDHSKCIPF